MPPDVVALMPAGSIRNLQTLPARDLDLLLEADIVPVSGLIFLEGKHDGDPLKN